MTEPERRMFLGRLREDLDDQAAIKWMVDELLGFFAQGSEDCEQCGGRMAPVDYGIPSPSALEAAERGFIVLGGCHVRAIEQACVKCKWPLEETS